MIELKGVRKTYKAKKGSSTKALDDIYLKLADKGMTFILGKSGSGKSTLLNIIGGLDVPDSGEVIILGKNTKKFKNTDFDSYRNTYVGFVFQEFNLLEDYTVYENILLGLKLQQKKITRDKINDLLAYLGLTNLKQRKVNELSGGEKQRVAIARALVKNPKLILADEPTGNLDKENSTQVFELLKEISKDKLVVVVSHDEESAMTYADRIIKISDGIIISDTNNYEYIANYDKYMPIKSKLPFKSSLKLGLKSLKGKKIKLTFTIILTFLALTFLGITTALANYNINLVHANLLKKEQIDFIEVRKYKIFNNDYFERKELTLEDNDIVKIKNKLDDNTNLIYKIIDAKFQNYFSIYDALRINSSESNLFSQTLEVVESNNLKLDNLIGRSVNNKDEIVISSYIADEIIKNGIYPYDEDELYIPSDYNELISGDKTFEILNNPIKIVGIIKYDTSMYKETIDKRNEGLNLSNKEYTLLSSFDAKRKNIYNKIYVTSDFVNNLEVEDNLYFDSNYDYKLSSYDIKLDNATFNTISLLNDDTIYYNGSSWVNTKLKENEIVLNVSNLSIFNENDYRNKFNAYVNQNIGKNQLELEKEFFVDYIKDIDIIGKNVSILVSSFIYNTNDTYSNLKVVGITGLISVDNDDHKYFIADNTLSKYKLNAISKVGLFVKTSSLKNFKKIMHDFSYDDELAVNSPFIDTITSLIHPINIFKKVAFYLGIVFLIFTIILVTNLIVSSITSRKRDIGILRALGASNVSVVKIFIIEGIALAIISWLLSIVGLFISSRILNDYLSDSFNMLIRPTIISSYEIIAIFIIILVIVIVSSVTSILKIAKMKPVEAISNK